VRVVACVVVGVLAVSGVWLARLAPSLAGVVGGTPAVAAPLPESGWVVDPAVVDVDGGDGAGLAVGGESSWLWVPSVGVSAPIDRIQIVDGVLTPPADGSRVGRWSGGAGLGDDVGTVLVTGHVAVAGVPGALWRLSEIEPGARLVTADEAGRLTEWVASELRVTAAEDLHEDLFWPGGDRRLALVTCAGRVAAGVYTSGVVVIARPV
jgi:hypothetical protein